MIEKIVKSSFDKGKAMLELMRLATTTNKMVRNVNIYTCYESKLLVRNNEQGSSQSIEQLQEQAYQLTKRYLSIKGSGVYND